MAAASAFKHEPDRAFFGVETSASGRRWRERPVDLEAAEALRRSFGLPEVAARLLAGRGIALSQAARFLAPTLRDFFPDPATFRDMDAAAEILDDAIHRGRPTAVFADYDVDGGTSAALLVKYFRARGRSLRIYVPDRMNEGYGPNAAAFERLKAEGVELVITVDCGAVAAGPLAAAEALGLEVVVFDHHLMHGPGAPARALVNPNNPLCGSGQGALTAAGVVLVALAAVNRVARRNGSLGANHLPNPIEYLDLAALGTVCDVAPLTGFNRAIVAQGLKILSKDGNVGLAALGAVAGRKGQATVYDLGFVLGPRLNAGGRIGDASLAARLLSSEDPAEAAEIAQTLDRLNAERRAMCDDILHGLSLDAGDLAPVALIGRPEWHPGVIGIVAGRLKERLRKPVIVLGGGGGEEPAKGSGRSIAGVNLGAAVSEAAQAGVLAAGGGHAMAAGLTMDWRRFEDFRRFLSERLEKEVRAAEDEARTVWIDAMAGLPALGQPLLDSLDRIGPYGAGHPEPVFGFADLRVAFSKEIKGEHLSVTFEDSGGARARGIAFGAIRDGWADALRSRDRLVHVCARLKRNTFNGGNRAELEIVDAANGA